MQAAGDDDAACCICRCSMLCKPTQHAAFAKTAFSVLFLSVFRLVLKCQKESEVLCLKYKVSNLNLLMCINIYGHSMGCVLKYLQVAAALLLFSL